MHRREGRQETALLPRERLGEFLEHARLIEHRPQLTGAPQRTTLRKHPLGEVDRAGLEVPLDDLIDQAELERLGGP